MCFKHFISIEFKVESVWKNYIIQIRSTDLTYTVCNYTVF